MIKLKIKFCEFMIRHYTRLWRKAVNGMQKRLTSYTTAEFRRYAARNNKYGSKTLLWMDKKAKLLKGLV